MPIEAVSATDLEFLQGVDSPTLANAIEVFGLRERADGYVGGRVRSLFPDLPPMVGQALTVKLTNARGSVASRDGYWEMWEALSQMPSPSVVVMQDISGEPHRCAYAGEVMVTLSQRLGAVGMVTDGGYRDLAEVRAKGFQFFAQYVVVSHGNYAIQEVGDTVVIDGQEISTGDILHGDGNGIVVVPRETLPGLPAEVAKIQDRERRFMDFIASDAFTLEKARAGTGY